MNYQAALDRIWGLVNFETQPPATRAPYDLRRMWRLSERIGRPERQFQAVHVAGTKGKGSTAAMIESVLRAAGFRTGLYTSPHLHDPRERIQIGGVPVDEASFVALVERIEPALEALPETTTFEALTAMAFLAFAGEGVEVAVVEVGLGGRLDATILIRPLVSVITPLALEHTSVLGSTIEAIAGEKGGIIKPGVPVVSAPQPPAAAAVLRAMARARAAPFYAVEDSIAIRPRERSLVRGQRFDLTVNGRSYRDLSLPLVGDHQLANASTTVLALEVVREQGLEIGRDALRAGLAGVRWPARIEVVYERPLVVVDGAHTAESMAALTGTLAALQPEGWPHITAIVGISADKSPESLLAPLLPMVQHLVLTRANHPRAADPAALATSVRLAIPGLPVSVEPNVASAVTRAREQSGPDDLILATGSLFVAAEARAALGRT